MDIDAVIVAAGTGTRFKGYKQFYTIGNKPILIYTLQTLQLVEPIKRMIIVVPKGMSAKVRQMVKRFHIGKVGGIVTGGKRRIDSVRSGLTLVKTKKVIIHDAVRPLPSHRLIQRLISAMKKYPAVVPVLPVHDTIKEVAGGYVKQTIPRRSLYLSQTPQGFDTRLLKKVLSRPPDLDFTDEAALLESVGIRVRVISGEATNIKVTRRSDLKILRKVL